MVYHQGCLGWHREQALCSPATLLTDAPLSSVGVTAEADSTLKGEPWGGTSTPHRLGASSPPLACVFPRPGLRQRRHFQSTDSSLLPQDDLVSPCHERKVTSWGVRYMNPFPPAYSIAQPLNLVRGKGLLIRIVGVQGQGQSYICCTVEEAPRRTRLISQRP